MVFVGHPDAKSLESPCGGKFVFSLRDDILEMEAASKKFEQEDMVLVEIQKQSRYNSDPYLYPFNAFAGDQDDEYFPYCEIKFEPEAAKYQSEELELSHQTKRTSSDGTENARPEHSETFPSSVASTACSFVGSNESPGTSTNVRI